MRLHFNTKDLTGKKFDRLLVVSYVGSNRQGARWDCLCDCGNRHVAKTSHLTSGNVRSCGCLSAEKASERGKLNSTHGMCGTLTYNSWLGMIQRCYNQNNQAYPRYGGIGIKACEFLKCSPRHIIDVIGERPDRQMTLDRINNNLGYHCGVCAQCVSMGFSLNIRWATKLQQVFNRRITRFTTIAGVSKSISEWVRELMIPRTTLYRYAKEQEALDDWQI